MGSSSPRNNFYHQNWRGSGLYMYMYKTGEGLGYTCTCTKLARVWAIHVHVQNLVYNLGMGTSLQKNNFYYQNWRGDQTREASKKWENPLLISATIEASNFKFGTQLRFGEYITITTLVPNLVGAGLQEYLKHCGTTYLYHVPCTTTWLATEM